jgi:hypothetical protein
MIVAAPMAVDPCGDVLTVHEIHVSCSRRLVSPDGRWQVVIKGEDGPGPQVHLDRALAEDTAYVADSKSHVIASFDMQRNAKIYWLKDGQTLIVNYYAGSNRTRPLAIRLGHVQGQPLDLSELVLPDVLKRIHKRQRQVYHYYVRFLADQGNRVTFAAEPEFTINGNYGPGDARCLIYSIGKATFHSYRFVREVPDDKCPETADAS